MTELQPVTEEAFTASRTEFFHGFTKFMLYAAMLVIGIVALMGIFLG